MSERHSPLTVRLLTVLLFAVFGSTSAAKAGGDPSCVTSFSYSKDPKKVVLFVQSLGTTLPSSLSMTLYGDGRLEVAHKYADSRGLRAFELKLTQDEVDSLLQLAVDFGLAEWDDARIEAEQMKRTGGAVAATLDADALHVTLSLELFRRGDWSVGPVEKRIRFSGADYAMEVFPEIEEFKGLVQLQDYMTKAYWRAAGVAE